MGTALALVMPTFAGACWRCVLVQAYDDATLASTLGLLHFRTCCSSHMLQNLQPTDPDGSALDEAEEGFVVTAAQALDTKSSALSTSQTFSKQCCTLAPWWRCHCRILHWAAPQFWRLGSYSRGIKKGAAHVLIFLAAQCQCSQQRWQLHICHNHAACVCLWTLHERPHAWCMMPTNPSMHLRSWQLRMTLVRCHIVSIPPQLAPQARQRAASGRSALSWRLEHGTAVHWPRISCCQPCSGRHHHACSQHAL